MSAPLRSEVSALQRLPSPFNRTTCHWCAEPADSEVPTRTGLRWACSRCAPYVRVPATKQPMGDDSPLCAKCDLPVSDRLHADDHMFTQAATDFRWRDPLLNTNTTTKETTK